MVRHTSLKFKHMSRNTTQLVFEMLCNQNLMRYIHYLGEYNPLDSRLPNVDPQEVKKANFILTKFNDKILEEFKVMIFVNPAHGKFTGGAIADDYYEIVTIIPREYWVIKGTSQLRAFQIAYEIAQSLDQQNIAGIGLVEIKDWNTFKVNDKSDGLVLLLQVSNATMKGMQ